MKVSVVIPVFNKAPFLKECLDSVLNGAFQDIEVVAVDDASTDGSLELLRAHRDPRLRVIALERNLGPAGAANRGLDEARGDYIVRLDADDIMVPDRIARQVAFMDANPDIGASSGALQLFGEDDHVWRFPLTDAECRAQLLFAAPLSQGASILRRSVLQEHAVRYDGEWPRVGEDWLFWARLMRVTRVANLPEVLTRYRRGEQNISRGTDKVLTHRVILRYLFEMHRIPAAPADIDTHLMALTYFAAPPDAASVRRLRAWLDHLLDLDRMNGLFPHEAFRARVEKAWDMLFHYLPRHGLAPALTHLHLSRRWPVDRLVFLLKVRLKALFNPDPK